MNKIIKLQNIFTAIVIISIFYGCNGQKGRSKGTLIAQIGSKSGIEEFSCPYIDALSTFCTIACDTKKNHIADKNERAELEEKLKTLIEPLEESERNFKLENFQKAGNVCVDGLIVVRPENSVFVNRSYCACQENKKIISNDCDYFCQSKADTTPTLFGTVSVGPKISANKDLVTLANWCTKEIADGGVAPSCTLEVRSQDSRVQLQIDIPANSNSFSVNLSSLAKGVPYTARIIEAGSNTNNASSDYFQFLLLEIKSSIKIREGPLWIMPVSQYNCLERVGFNNIGTVSDTFSDAVGQHFYFASNNIPPPIPPSNDEQFSYVCHDINIYTIYDNITYPRLGLIPQSFTTWNRFDPRFRDLDGNSKMDIADAVEAELKTQFGITQNLADIFKELPWPNSPIQSAGSTPPSLGFYLQAIVNPTTGRATCPDQKDYFGNDPLFQSLKNLIGVSTEALYIAEREPTIKILPDGNTEIAPNDILLIRESLLKRVWFYIENNLKIVPDEVTKNQKTIMFFYPTDIQDPYIKKSFQRTYIVKSSETIGQASSADSSINSTPDKRLGCIPAAEEVGNIINIDLINN